MTLKTIRDARELADLMLPGEEPDQTFKRLAIVCHPDLNPADPDMAHEAMAHLNRLRKGEAAPEVKIGKWSIREPFASGDIADVYRTDNGAVFKIARSKADNDLMDRERRSLTLLHDKDAEPKLSRYIPQLHDSMLASGRRANVLESAEDYITLEEIRRRYGRPIEFRHIVWMMNRLLSGIGYAHRRGIVHGGLVPSNLMYDPKSHNMKIVDWCYSCTPNERVPAIAKNYRAMYPPEVFEKMNATPGTDMFMAARSLFLAADRVPPLFRYLYDYCVVGSPASRPSDVWTFQDRWRETAKRVYGDPKFVELTIPVH